LGHVPAGHSGRESKQGAEVVNLTGTPEHRASQVSQCGQLSKR